MIDKLRGEPREIYALLIVFLLALGAWHFSPRFTLPDYSAAMQMRDAAAGSAGAQLECAPVSECVAKPVPPHIAFALLFERACAALSGVAASSPQAIVPFLLVFPSVLLAVSSTVLYLALREFGNGKSLSALGAMLFALSLSSLAFLPGVYGSASVASLSLALFLFCLASYGKKQGVGALVLGLAFAACAGYLNAAFGVAAALAALSIAAARKMDNSGEMLVQLAAFAAVALAAAFLSPERPALTEGAVLGAFSLLPFMIAAASISAALFAFGAGKLEQFLLFLSGIAAAALSPPAGAAVLAIPAASGMGRIAGEAPKNCLLAGAFFAAFFALFGISMPFPSIAQALVVAALLGGLFPLILHLYDYHGKAFFSAIGILLACLAAFCAVFAQVAPNSNYPAYTDADYAASLAGLSAKGAASIATLERADAVSFYLPGARVEDAKKTGDYLLGKGGAPQGGSYIVLPLSRLSALSENATFEVCAYGGNLTYENGAVSALFNCQSGRRILREVGANGQFALKDGSMRDYRGYYYGSLALSRMVMLQPSKPFFATGNLLIVVDEGSLPPHFAALFAGEDAAAEKEGEYGRTFVFKAK